MSAFRTGVLYSVTMGCVRCEGEDSYHYLKGPGKRPLDMLIIKSKHFAPGPLIIKRVILM